MRTNALEDPWLLPTHQDDYPTLEVLPESRLHGRREGTFLALVALFLAATITLPLIGTSRVIDLALLVPELELPVALHFPLGIIAVPLGFLAINLVGELYGRRRATALVWIGLAVTLATIGLMRLSDQTGGVDAAFGPALGFAAFYLVAHVTNVLLFDALRRKMGGHGLALRSIITTVVAQLVGWIAFAFVLYGYFARTADAGVDIMTPITAMTFGALAYATACALVLVVPLVILARSLAPYLRIARFASVDDPDVSAARRRRLPAAVLIDSSPALPRLPTPLPGRTRHGVSERRAARQSIQPFNSAEMRFFTEGDELAERDPSSPDLSADAAAARSRRAQA
jgi:uncharacterized PurR-regulated membrane protein YhhQ (DUF165 family)